MSNRKDQSHWFIIIAVLIIIVLVVVLSTNKRESLSEQEEEIQKRNEEEKNLILELEALERKKEIYTKHEAINSFTDKYMGELCEKRYKQLIQVLVILLLVSNIIVYFSVPKIDLMSQFTWNGMALGVLNLLAIFFFTSVKRAKEYIKEMAMTYIEFRVYENRDKTYFTKKVVFYRNEIEKLEQEITDKGNDLHHLRKNSNFKLSSTKNE